MPPHDPHHDPDHPHETPPEDPGPPEHPPKPHDVPPEEAVSLDDADGYLFAVDYDDDAERKRAEYLFNTWEGGEVHKPDGVVRIAEDVDQDELYRQLLVKFRAEQVEAYALSTLDVPEAPETRTIERTIDADPETIRSVLQYLLSRKKGESTGENTYEVYTHKGRADVSLSLSEESAGTTATVVVEGHPPVIDELAAYLREELEAFEASR